MQPPALHALPRMGSTGPLGLRSALASDPTVLSFGQQRHYHKWYYRSKQVGNRLWACEQPEELEGLIRVAGKRFSFINWAQVLQRLAAMSHQHEGGASSSSDRVEDGTRVAMLRTACSNISKLAKW